MRPIDADVMKEHLKTLEADSANKTYKRAMQDMIDHYFPKIIDAQPTINPEQRCGRWILERKPDGTPYCLHCSECDPDFAVIYNQVATEYCPDCGAKMETDSVYERDDYDGTY